MAWFGLRAEPAGCGWRRTVLVFLPLVTLGVAAVVSAACAETPLEVGFAQADITPELRDDAPVWLAGYYPGRRATGVHDPLFARCVVLRAGTQKLAWVAVDLIGLQYPAVELIRRRLPDFGYVLVASTHNHEGPDMIGIWGESFLHRGVDEQYVALVIERVVESVRQAEQDLRSATAEYGTAADESLLSDVRRPVVKDGVLRILRFRSPADASVLGLVVQWNCHPEALGPHNTLITADFPAATIAALQGPDATPVVYFSGAIGGLMAPPQERLRDQQGNWLREGSFEFARRYGEEVARLAERALADAQPIDLAPMQVAAHRCGVPVTNELYRWARLFGILRREVYVWNPRDRTLGDPLRRSRPEVPSAIATEVACLRLGELYVAAIPGEIYPELVYDFDEPSPPEVDFPDAPWEPRVVDVLPSDRWLLLGLANDEVGYLIPRRQWDGRPPYAYNPLAPQYGEINSCGPDTAQILLDAWQACVAELLANTPVRGDGEPLSPTPTP